MKPDVKPIKVLFIGQGKHATTNLYPSLPYAGIELVESCTRDYHIKLTQYVDKIDAVIACVNAQAHAEIAYEATQRGLPVFIEKPPAWNSEDIKRLLPYKDTIMVGFNKRFAPTYKEAYRILPKPSTISINIYVGEIKDKETLLKEVGIHYIDLLAYFGKPISTFNISGNYSWSKPNEHIEIVGNGQLVIIDNVHTIIHHKPSIIRPGEMPYESEKSTIWQPNYNTPNIENSLIFLNGYVGELTHFANCVRKKKPMSPNIKDGYDALVTAESMMK